MWTTATFQGRPRLTGNPACRRSSAFTLVEVMVAFGVMALVAVGIFGSVSLSQRMLRQSRSHLEAEGIVMDNLWLVTNSNSFDNLLAMANSATPTTTVSLASTNGLIPDYSDSFLANYGGTLRTAVTIQTDTATSSKYVNVWVRLDWVNRAVLGGKQRAESESLSMNRYQTDR